MLFCSRNGQGGVLSKSSAKKLLCECPIFREESMKFKGRDEASLRLEYGSLSFSPNRDHQICAFAVGPR